MEEGKPYPKFEEEDGSCLTASEPAVAVAEPSHLINTHSPVYQEIRNPDSHSPRTVEELIAEIDNAEQHWDDPDEWVTSEQVWKDVRELFPWANI